MVCSKPGLRLLIHPWRRPPVHPPARSPYRIGLTGNIATGKSTVARMLGELGALHIDADEVAHSVIAVGGLAYPAVVAAFGTTMLRPDGSIDRRKLGAQVFSDPEALARLEALVHPPVIAEINRRIAGCSQPVVVVEAIKLLESGMAESYDAIWVTTCSREAQLLRLVEDRALSQEEAERRIAAQADAQLKLARADVVIDTEGTLDATRAQVVAAWQRIASDSLYPSTWPPGA